MSNMSDLYEQLREKRKEHQRLLENLNHVEPNDASVDAIVHRIGAVESELVHIRAKIEQQRAQKSAQEQVAATAQYGTKKAAGRFRKIAEFFVRVKKPANTKKAP